MPERNGEHWLGKLPLHTLESRVLARISPVKHPQTLIGATPGEDAAVIDMGFCDLVIHVDPITEAGDLAGWLALNVASNDVAVTGAKPKWAMLTILLPQETPELYLERIVESVRLASRELEVEIVGGHTEVTPGLKRPIVVATVWGCTCRGCIVPTGGARPGDLVLQVKPAGIEGTSILATDFRELLLKRGVDARVIDRAAGFHRMISVVKEALTLAEGRLVSSMHDPTEGGLIGGLVEIAYASGVSIEVDKSRILVRPETRIIASAFNIDPLKLISSGTLLATIKRGFEEDVARALEDLNAEYSIIGEVLEKREWLLRVNEDSGYTVYNEPPQDEISRIWVDSHEGGGEV